MRCKNASANAQSGESSNLQPQVTDHPHILPGILARSGEVVARNRGVDSRKKHEGLQVTEVDFAAAAHAELPVREDEPEYGDDFQDFKGPQFGAAVGPGPFYLVQEIKRDGSRCTQVFYFKCHFHPLLVRLAEPEYAADSGEESGLVGIPYGLNPFIVGVRCAHLGKVGPGAFQVVVVNSGAGIP